MVDDTLNINSSVRQDFTQNSNKHSDPTVPQCQSQQDSCQGLENRTKAKAKPRIIEPKIWAHPPSGPLVATILNWFVSKADFQHVKNVDWLGHPNLARRCSLDDNPSHAPSSSHHLGPTQQEVPSNITVIPPAPSAAPVSLSFLSGLQRYNQRISTGTVTHLFVSGYFSDVFHDPSAPSLGGPTVTSPRSTTTSPGPSPIATLPSTSPSTLPSETTTPPSLPGSSPFSSLSE
ncbi:hypothetical protein Fmac_019116 [Flemingia macrophylla]|uniref:Uncharacterized protein n=1 Tax=Flemingia macrophylla TaxID=520843 RepID=A0ABD1M8V5_9FABA